MRPLGRAVDPAVVPRCRPGLGSGTAGLIENDGFVTPSLAAGGSNLPVSRSLFVGLAAGVALSAPACAADVDTATAPKGWIVTVRAIAAVAPSYPGSGTLRPYPFPSIDIRRVGDPELFSTPDDSFGFALVDYQGFRAGPVANFVFKRGQRDGLVGMRPVSLTHEIGGFLEFRTGEHFRTRVELRQGVDGHEGFVAALGADLFGGDGRATVSIGPRFSLGDNRYANAYFSVTPVESFLNGRIVPYEATGGFTAAGGLATFRYDFTKNMNATLFGGLQRLTGSVGASPIPNEIGSRNQFTAGLSIARSFVIPNLAW
jgi:outer membrane scaffolding protein for murein synthesis (MipA/OmpV family)